MSNGGQLVSGVAGGAIGFFVGGPAGAVYGLQIASLAGSVLFPTQLPGIQGPRLEDFEQLQADPGSPMFAGWGRFVVPGFRMYLGEVVESSSTETVGGKGGPEQDVETFTYTQTLALGLVDTEVTGPIGGVMRIWENGKIVYDAREQQDEESTGDYAARVAASGDYAATFTLYTGTQTQLADPTLELEQGVGNVPGFRGQSYLVFPNRQLQQSQGNRHPIFKVEIFTIGQASETEIMAVGFNAPPDDARANLSLTHGDWTAKTSPGSSSGPMSTLVAIIRIEALSRWLVLSGNSQGGANVTPGNIPIRWSDDDGGTWVAPAAGGPASWNSHRNLLRVANGNLVTAGGQGFFEAFYSEDNGSTWQASTNDDDFATFQVASNFMVREGFGFIAAVMTLGSRCFKSVDNGVTWQKHAMNVVSGGPLAFSAPLGLFAMMTDNKIYTSSNCEIWVERATQSVAPVAGASGGAIIWSDELAAFVSLGATGTLRSDAGIVWTNLGPAPASRNVIFSSARGVLYAANPATGTQTAVYHYSEDGGVTWVADAFAETGRWQSFAEIDAPIAVAETVPISTILRDICLMAGLGEEDIDVSAHTENDIIGYCLSRFLAGRGAIEPLRMVGLFDYVESEGLLKFPARGGAAVATVLDADLGVAEEGAAMPAKISTRRVQDVELPRQIRLQYQSFSRDYEQGEQLSPARIGTVGVNDVTIECAVIMDDDTAAQVVEIAFREAWASRHSHEWALDQSWHRLEPGDPVLVPVDGRNYRARVVAINDAAMMIRKFEAVRDDSGAYVSTAVADPTTRPPSVLELLADTELVFLDLPALREADDDAGFYLVARAIGGNAWTGARVHRSVDGGSSFAQIAALAAEGIVGEVVTAPSGDVYTWDDSAALVVDVVTEDATLQSRTDAAVRAGANTAAIGADGRWLLVQFADVALVAPGRYRCSRMLLGRRGTEHLVGSVLPGDAFVLVSGPGVYRITQALADIDQERIYRAVTDGATFATGTDVPFTGTGEALEPFSPVHLRGARDGSNNLTISWIRRDRLSATLRPGVETPLNEATEGYSIDILDDDTDEPVLRTLTSSATSVVYSAAQQTTDFGGPQDSIRVRVYQLSATVGRGMYREAFL